MASTASPYGLRLVKRLGETNQRHGFNQYPIASGYATDLKVGDIVLLHTTGKLQKDTGTTACTPIGVFIGCSYTDSAMGFLNRAQWTASTVASDAMGYVVDDPDAVFQIQASASVAANGLGANAAVVQGSGSLALGRSGVSLNAATLANTATLPVRIVGFPSIPGFSTVGDSFTDVYVRFNTHVSRSTTGNTPS
jgi:hypothetical protein